MILPILTWLPVLAAMLAGKNGDAEQEFRKAAELDPKKRQRRIAGWGFSFNATGKSKQAEDELTRAVALNPDDWRARINLGLLYYKTARYPEAAAAWEQVKKLTPDNFYVLNNLAGVYMVIGPRRRCRCRPAALPGDQAGR